MGIIEILCVVTSVFTVLKLVGVITLAWWVVLLPGIVAAVISIMVAIYVTWINHSIRKESKKFFDDFWKD